MPCHVYYIPILLGIVFPITFIITYVLSVVNKDLQTDVSYVSDTGVYSIQRCIFTFMLVIGSLLIFVTWYIRVRQVQQILEVNQEVTFKPNIRILNKISFYCCGVSVVGLLMLACFQAWLFSVVHLLGAGTCFSFSAVALAIQTYISLGIYPTFGSKLLNIIRVFLAGLIVITYLLTLIFGILSSRYFKDDDILQQNSSSVGYKFHTASVVNEWLLVLSIVLYLALYAVEFRSIVMYEPKIELVS